MNYYVNARQPWSLFIFWHEQLVSTFICVCVFVCVRWSGSLLAGSICIKEKLHEFSAKQNILHRDRYFEENFMFIKERGFDQTIYKLGFLQQVISSTNSLKPYQIPSIEDLSVRPFMRT